MAGYALLLAGAILVLDSLIGKDDSNRRDSPESGAP
jgi:hypothetical protein